MWHQSNCQLDHDVYFKALKNKQFESARLHIEANNHIENKGYSILVELVENVVQIEISQIEFDQSVSGKIMENLIKGYNEFYSTQGSSLVAYNFFSEALNLANSFNSIELTKFSLISILEVLRKEIFIGSKQFRPYLNHYNQLIDSKDDEIIYALYQVTFSSKEDEKMSVALNYDKTMVKLDSLFRDLSDVYPLMPYYLYEKAIQNKLKGNFAEAIEYNRRALEISNKNHLQRLKGVLLWQMAHTSLLMNDLSNTEHYLTLSEQSAVGMRDDFYDKRLKAWLFEAKGQFDSAFVYLNSSVDLEYRLGAKNNSLETALLSVENETKKLKLDNLTSEAKRKRNQNWLIAASLALLLGTGIAILLQKNTSKKRQLAEQEAILKQQRVENLLKEQELVSIDAMIAGQEKERQKVAGELHDDLGSLMATIKLHFDNAKVAKQDPALKNAQKLLEEAYQKIRGMAHNKNSGVMSDQGLLLAIKKMAKTITETNALKVEVEDFGMGERLENSLELSIFRMVQELVANAIKHAEASRVNIQLTQHEDNLNIIIEDNGKGFDRSKLDKSKSGMGLTTIEKRVEHLEGNFTVDSVVGKGTSILIEIPV